MKDTIFLWKQIILIAAIFSKLPVCSEKGNLLISDPKLNFTGENNAVSKSQTAVFGYQQGTKFLIDRKTASYKTRLLLVISTKIQGTTVSKITP